MAIADRPPSIVLNRNYTNNFTIKDHILNNLVPRYYPNVDINKLNIGMIGLTSEFLSTMTEDLFHSASVLMNEYFPNRCIYDSSIYAHAAIFGIDNNFAFPANGVFVLGIEKRSLLEAMNAVDANNLSNGIVNPLANSAIYPIDGPFIIPKETEFHIISNDKDFCFSPDYDVAVIAKFNANNKWLFRAYYTNQRTPWYNNSITSEKNSNVKIKEMRDGYVYLALNLFQKKNLEVNYNITSNSMLNIPEFFIDIPDGFQVSGMDCAYKDPHSSDYMFMDHLQVFQMPLSSPFCYYEFSDSNKLKISFGLNSSRFQPAFNSDVKIIVYLTNGASGNYTEYNDDVQVIKAPNHESNRRLTLFATAFGPSVGGHNSYSVEDLRGLTLSAFGTCNTLTTENDILRHFVDFNIRNGSKIRPIKKRDDLFERRYMAYTILKPITREIYMCNTMHLLANTDMFDEFHAIDGTAERISSYTLKAGKLFAYLNDCDPMVYQKIATNAPYFVRDDLAATAESLHMTCTPVGIPVPNEWSYVYCTVFDEFSGGTGYLDQDIVDANGLQFVVIQTDPANGAILALAYPSGSINWDPTTDPTVPCPVTGGSGSGAYVKILAHQATLGLYNIYDTPLELLEELEKKYKFLYTSQFQYVFNLFDDATVDTVNIFDNNLKYNARPDEVKIEEKIFTQFIVSRFKIERSLKNNTEYICSAYVNVIVPQENIDANFKYINTWLDRTVEADMTMNNLRIFIGLRSKNEECAYLELYPEKVDKSAANPDEPADNVNVIKFRTVIRSTDGLTVSPFDESIVFNLVNTKYETYPDYYVGTDVDGYPLSHYRAYNTVDSAAENSSNELAFPDACSANVNIYVMYRPFSQDEVSNANIPVYGLPKSVQTYISLAQSGYTAYYQPGRILLDYVQCAVYDTSSTPVDFYRQMELINSTILYNGWEIVADPADLTIQRKRDYLTAKFLPFIKWNIIREVLPENPSKSEFYERFIPEFNYTYNQLVAAIPNLANSMRIDMKYYNTYGKSANTFISDDTLIDRTSIKLYFRIFLRNESLYNTTCDEIRKIVKKFVETLNDEGVNSVYISNIIKTIEQEVINVDHLIFMTLNEYNNPLYQSIINKTPDPDEMSKSQIYNYVPEFINISDENIILDLGRMF